MTSEELIHEANSRKFGVPETVLARAFGIKQRRFSDAQESFADLAVLASQQAIQEAAIDPLAIDMILFCGIEKEFKTIGSP